MTALTPVENSLSDFDACRNAFLEGHLSVLFRRICSENKHLSSKDSYVA